MLGVVAVPRVGDFGGRRVVVLVARGQAPFEGGVDDAFVEVEVLGNVSL